MNNELIEIYKNYDQRREDLNIRRSQRNSFYSIFLSTLLSGVAFLTTNSEAEIPKILLLLISTFGLILSILWYLNIKAIKERVQAKYKVIIELEEKLCFDCYTREIKFENADGDNKFWRILLIESLVPFVLASAYISLIVYIVTYG